MIPIKKNIAVVDEQGNTYEATYPKRAKGLVKNGRARFISENQICLVCPPEILEDYMSNTIEQKNTVDVDELEKNTDVSNEKLSMNYVLEQIEKIVAHTDYLGQTIGAIGQLESADDTNDVALQAKATALGDVVRCRETTNQQLIKLYEKMYDDLKEQSYREKAAEKKNCIVKNFEEMAQFLKTLNRDEFDPEAWRTLHDAATAQLHRAF